MKLAKSAFLLSVLMLVANTAFAQEIDLGLGGDASSLLNLPAPTGRAATPPPRGAAPARGAAPNTPPVDRLVRLRELLAGANAPLTKEQETGLNALLNAEIPAMRKNLQARILQMQKTRGGAPPPGAPAPVGAPTTPAPSSAAPASVPQPPRGASQAAGPAAGQRGAPANLPSMDELAPEIIRLNDQLLGKIAAAPSLNSQQQSLIQKVYKDQVKSRGGFDAIKLRMEEAGVAFSAEQVAQIQPLFDQQNEKRAELVRESQGQPPDKARLDQLQRETLSQVLKLLTAAQRTALLTPK